MGACPHAHPAGSVCFLIIMSAAMVGEGGRGEGAGMGITGYRYHLVQQ